MKNKKNKKGFTLTELIIVIVIIGILAAVLVPSLTGYIKKAKISNDTSDCKNMNTLLTTYAYEHSIDLSKLDAAEVRTIVSLENKNYTFVPSYKKGVFTYNQVKGLIEYNSDGIDAYADDSYTPYSVEEISENVLYLNTTGDLANALSKLRNLYNKSTYLELKEQHTFEGIDISKILNEFNPETTLFITSNGGFTSYDSTLCTYNNMPALNSTDGKWYWNYDESNKIYSNELKVNDSIEDDINGTVLTSEYVSVAWTGDKLMFTKANGSKLMVTVNTQSRIPSTYPDAIHKIVFADNLTVIPALNTTNLDFTEDTVITLPTYVKAVMPNAFTNVKTETKIETKMKKQNVQYVEGSLSVLMQNANENIEYVSLDSLSKSVTQNACLLEFEVTSGNTTYIYKVVENDGVYKFGKYDSNGTLVSGYTEKEIIPDTATSIRIDEIISEGGSKLKIVTKKLVKKYEDINTVNIDYQYIQNEVNATIRAFTDKGMIINMIVCYKTK